MRITHLTSTSISHSLPHSPPLANCAVPNGNATPAACAKRGASGCRFCRNSKCNHGARGGYRAAWSGSAKLWRRARRKGGILPILPESEIRLPILPEFRNRLPILPEMCVGRVREDETCHTPIRFGGTRWHGADEWAGMGRSCFCVRLLVDRPR